MHGSVMQWVRDVIFVHELKGKSILEVGSYDENGSVRHLFHTKDYVGVDMRSGPGVDRVINAHYLAVNLPGPYDVIVCTEMLEHDDRFWVSLHQMGLVLRQGGHLILTTRGNGFPHHAYPDDYWRFMPDSGTHLLDLASCDQVVNAPDPQHPGLFLLGVKR